ncbi:putative Endochitinase [Hypsibius exemplaris]|uniref:Endochitinase n=1 Tax=Hypsibius exemplaris TaxID=2072580 RepID=A0A1W0WHC7_HYPEX|nr:putative Endochitinase [Hypsibius exemplaris]
MVNSALMAAVFLVVCVFTNVTAQLVTYDQFVNAVTSSSGYGAPSLEQYNNLLNRAGNGQITTKRELAMFLANIIHESAGLTTKEEWGPPPAGTYTSSDDWPGRRYHGRGYMQLTYGYNYKAASEALYRDHRLLNDPDQVKTNDAIAWDTSFWFWSVNVHNAPGVQSGNFGTTILKINGDRECGNSQSNPTVARRRIQIYEAVLRSFCIAGDSVDCSNPCNCVIPTGSSCSGGGESSCKQTYTVQWGDSFWAIANTYGMTIDQLQTLNPEIADPSTIYPGELICVRH